MIPKKIFFTKGIGTDKDRRVSFENALKDAGIEKFNLVYVSSILPPNCEIIDKKEGLKKLKPGEIVYCVMAKNETNEANRTISASIGIAKAKKNKTHGYLAEYNSIDETEEKTGKDAEDIAARMLSDSLKERIHQSEFITSNISQSFKTTKKSIYATVVATAVFVP